jgi:hypothetical protein
VIAFLLRRCELSFSKYCESMMTCGGFCLPASTGEVSMSRIIWSVMLMMSWPSMPTPATGPRVPGSSCTVGLPATF